MKRWGLRTKLILWSASVTGVALLTLVGSVVFSLYAEQVEMIDVRLQANAQMAFAKKSTGSSPDVAALRALISSSRRRRDESALYGYVLLRTRDGAVLEAEPAALARAAKSLPPRSRDFSATADGVPLRFDVFSPGGGGSDLRLRFGVFRDEGNTLLLAAPLEPAEESVEDVLGAALIAIPIVLLVVGGGSWWIAQQALQPISTITRAAETITAERLDARLPLPAADDEIGRHTRVLNAMFDRLQRSFEQATRFTADASHELRTPLTILRGEIEEALRSGQASPEQEKMLVGLLEQTGTLQKISANLLLLARFDAGKTTLGHTSVDLSALVADAIEDAELLAAPARVSVTAEVTPGLIIPGDAVLLRRVLLNLVENAVRYNRAEGQVRFTLAAEVDAAVFRLANTGPGIPAAKHEELFQRFFRLDPDRNRASGGSGLGLSLCREIVLAHGGAIALGRSDETWTEFVVRLPRSHLGTKPAPS